MNFGQGHVDFGRRNHRVAHCGWLRRAVRAQPVSGKAAQGRNQCRAGGCRRGAIQQACAFKQEIRRALIMPQRLERVCDLVVPVAPRDRVRELWLTFDNSQGAGQKIHRLHMQVCLFKMMRQQCEGGRRIILGGSAITQDFRRFRM